MHISSALDSLLPLVALRSLRGIGKWKRVPNDFEDDGTNHIQLGVISTEPSKAITTGFLICENHVKLWSPCLIVDTNGVDHNKHRIHGWHVLYAEHGAGRISVKIKTGEYLCIRGRACTQDVLSMPEDCVESDNTNDGDRLNCCVFPSHGRCHLSIKSAVLSAQYNVRHLKLPSAIRVY